MHFAAIRQIKERGYAQALEGYAGKILLVGISYNRKTKRHFCEIEREAAETMNVACKKRLKAEYDKAKE